MRKPTEDEAKAAGFMAGDWKEICEHIEWKEPCGIGKCEPECCEVTAEKPPAPVLVRLVQHIQYVKAELGVDTPTALEVVRFAHGR